MRRGTHQPPGLRRLQGVLASTQRKVATLANEQAALRVWRHALRIVAQSLCEIAQWRMARGVECGAELEELRQMLDGELQGSDGRAPAAGGGASSGPANSGPSSSTTIGEGTRRDCSEGSAVASGGSRTSDGSSSHRPPPPPQGCPPHLLSGESLIHLEGTTPEELERVRRGDTTELKSLWRQWVEEALMLELTPSPAAAQQLFRVGRRMQRLMSLLVFENYQAFARFNATQCTSDQMVEAGGDGDLQHWQRVVRAIRPTRYQAQLMLEINRMCDNCLITTRRRREGLIQRLKEVWVGTPAALPLPPVHQLAPAQPTPGDGAGRCDGDGKTTNSSIHPSGSHRSEPPTGLPRDAAPAAAAATMAGQAPQRAPVQSAVADVAAQALGDTSLECWSLLEQIEGTVRRDRAVLALHHNALFAVMTSAQQARLFATSFPYPAHQPMLCAVMETALRLHPDMLATEMPAIFEGV